MDTIGGTVTAVLTSFTGYGWALYFLGAAVVVGWTLAVEHIRSKKGTLQ